jgi:hypothetical protein
VKRKIIPGGFKGVAEEVALSPQQVRMAANPYASTRQLIAAAGDIGAAFGPNR